MNIRPAEARDLPALEAVLDGTGLFPSEMLADMVGGFLADGDVPDLWLTCEAGGTAIGFCCAAPEEMTERTWTMLALAVLPARQGAGAGAALVAHF